MATHRLALGEPLVPSDLAYESLRGISDLIRTKKISSAEITDAILQRIAKLDGQYHSYATVLTERALDRAKAADAEIARGLWRGPLHGVPIAVKDLCFTSFAPTQGGTAIFKSFVPSFNATVVERLEDAGAILLGKLQMTEGAYTSHHPQVAAPLNPWNTDGPGGAPHCRARARDQ
jgi:amidase